MLISGISTIKTSIFDANGVVIETELNVSVNVFSCLNYLFLFFLTV